jgi:hypothetical protein
MTIPNFTLKQLQEENKVWATHNFGNVNRTYAYHPLLGIIEELGELEQALYDMYTSDIWDAIGDVMIYMADYCNRMDLDLDMISKQDLDITLDCHIEVFRILGKLCHAQLKLEQGIRGDDDVHITTISEYLAVIITALKDICNRYNWEFMCVVSNVWDLVSKRDWKKNTETGDV